MEGIQQSPPLPEIPEILQLSDTDSANSDYRRRFVGQYHLAKAPCWAPVLDVWEHQDEDKEWCVVRCYNGSDNPMWMVQAKQDVGLNTNCYLQRPACAQYWQECNANAWTDVPSLNCSEFLAWGDTAHLEAPKTAREWLKDLFSTKDVITPQNLLLSLPSRGTAGDATMPHYLLLPANSDSNGSARMHTISVGNTAYKLFPPGPEAGHDQWVLKLKDDQHEQPQAFFRLLSLTTDDQCKAALCSILQDYWELSKAGQKWKVTCKNPRQCLPHTGSERDVEKKTVKLSNAPRANFGFILTHLKTHHAADFKLVLASDDSSAGTLMRAPEEHVSAKNVMVEVQDPWAGTKLTVDLQEFLDTNKGIETFLTNLHSERYKKQKSASCSAPTREDDLGDMAYWFPYCSSGFENGSIVKLREGKLVAAEKGEKGYEPGDIFLVVSDLHAKWKGPQPEDEKKGHWCAWLGQVPLKTTEPVKAGDYIGVCAAPSLPDSPILTTKQKQDVAGNVWRLRVHAPCTSAHLLDCDSCLVCGAQVPSVTALGWAKRFSVAVSQQLGWPSMTPDPMMCMAVHPTPSCAWFQWA